jgi:hypothetical protein
VCVCVCVNKEGQLITNMSRTVTTYHSSINFVIVLLGYKAEVIPTNATKEFLFCIAYIYISII